MHKGSKINDIIIIIIIIRVIKMTFWYCKNSNEQFLYNNHASTIFYFDSK